MSDYAQLYRIFNLISILRSPLGCSKTSFLENREITVRTFERYISLLKDLGFQIERKGKQYRIVQAVKDAVLPEENIIFSLEEAALIKDALLNANPKSPIKNELLSKLYALTDLNEISNHIIENHISKNISEIRKAIKQKKQVNLKNYVSVNSNTQKDRLVEPIHFIQYFKYLLAYEPASGKVKQFKTDRFQSAEILNKKWKHKDRHRVYNTDLFGMSGDNGMNAKLLLSRRAASLLTEEFPGSEHSISKNKGHFIFQTTIFSHEGIGRFVMGLIDEVEILEPRTLKEYVLGKLGNVEKAQNSGKAEKSGKMRERAVKELRGMRVEK